MIIPIGHEQQTVRRQPWVTYTLMILCVAVFLPTHYSTRSQLKDGVERFNEVFEFYFEHPYLELDPRLQEALYGSGAEGAEEAFGEWFRQIGGREPTDPLLLAREQEELDRITEEAFASVEGTSAIRWGLIPAHVSPIALITYMFLHGGWLHLLGNLFFLYLSGPFIEDVWGRGMFAVFYLAAGVAAALAFAFRYPALEDPLVGASGAIAGVMGAFLVRHWNKKIRFFYWFFVFFRGTFSSPAWVMLPLWFAREVLSATTMDVLAPGTGGQVAYWAHVGGFAFGVVAATGVRLSRWEERFVDPSFEEQATVVNNVALERALVARAQGRSADAWTLLAKEVRRGPTNVDTALAFWELALELGRADQAAPAMVRAVKEEVRQGEAMLAFTHWRDLIEHAPSARVDPGLEARLAEVLVTENLWAEARDVVSVALNHASPETPAAVLLRLARLAEGDDQRRAAEMALSHPELPPRARQEMEALRSGADASGNLPERIPVSSDKSPPPGSMAVHTGVPLALRGDTILVHLDQRGQKSLPLERIKALSVAAIRPQGGKPTLVLDLFLDAPWDPPSRPRVVRFAHTRFDPRKLVSAAPSFEEAFRGLVDTILRASRAVPLPNPEAVRGRPLRTHSSFEAYETAILASALSPPGE